MEFVSPPASVVVGDTTPIQVRALNRSGDPIPDATITLFSLAPDTIAVPPGRLAVVGLVPGSGRIVAQAEQLRSDPLRISVTAP